MAKPPSKLAAVVRFPQPYRERFAPDHRLVQHCERLLADAKSGQLRALVYGTVYRDDLSAAGSVDHGWAVGGGTYYAASHAIGRLQRAWGRECDRDEKELDRPPRESA